MHNEPSKKELANIPRLYSTKSLPLKETDIYLHFFLGNNNWYIAEYDGNNIFFGFVCLNGLKEFAEWGLIDYKQLKDLKLNISSMNNENKFINKTLEVERNLFFKPRKACKVELINDCQGW